MKKFFAVLMATVMAIFGSSLSAFAAEESNAVATAAVVEDVPEGAEVLEVIDFDVTPDMVNENGEIAISMEDRVTLVDNTWNFTNDHRGADRSYAYSSISFAAQITDSNGNAVSDQISIQLKDYYSHTQYFTAYGDGAWYGNGNISIVANRTYYFYYKNLSSSTRTMKIHMVIYH